MNYSKTSNTLLCNPATQKAPGNPSEAAAPMQQAQQHWVRRTEGADGQTSRPLGRREF